MDYQVINGDSKVELDKLEANSIDSCVTDPPYELNFMSKKWDNTGIAFNVDFWKKVYRVLKPGAYLLAFGGSRTFHRIACAIEDAGFEIRDTLMYLYGSGFPKSHNVGLSIDKLNGCPDRGHRIAVANRCHPDGTVEPNGQLLEKYEGKTEEGKIWAGWGTALKPAFEPIIMARKPIDEKNIALNILKHNVGAINIDECRVGNEVIKGGTAPEFKDVGQKQKEISGLNCFSFGQVENAKMIQLDDHIGRFPANVITDGSDEVKANMPETSGAGGSIPKTKITGFGHNMGGKNEYTKGVRIPYESGEGNACLFFYTAKASKKDRDEGLDMFSNNIRTDGCIRNNLETARTFGANSPICKNIHPTVKPCELMQYLVRLVTPKGGVVLDPFNGSGSTGKATAFENRERDAQYKYIGIELDKEYCKISEARIDYAINKYEYDLKRELEEAGQINLFEEIK